MLLMLPDAYDAINVPGTQRGTVTFPTDSSGQMIWPTVGSVRDAAQEFSPIAISANPIQEWLARMLERAERLHDEARVGVVYSDEPIPADLIAGFPVSLHCLLRRVLPCDLLVISLAQLTALSRTDSIADVVFSSSCNAAALARSPVPERFPVAGPGNPLFSATAVRTALSRTLDSSSFSPTDRRCIEAGVLLLWDHLDQSHEVSQTMEGRGSPRTADYWHAIMHRREPDAGNASYWFQRVGRHPAFESLAEGLEGWMTDLGATEQLRNCARQRLLSGDGFDPFAMIELSQAAAEAPGSADDQVLRIVQYLEMLNLLRWSIVGQRGEGLW